MSQPTTQQREAVALRLEDLIDAITEHTQWRPQPNPNPTLYHVWDFVMRSKYMLSEYDNIKAGRPIQRPEQFRDGAGSGDEAALRCFQEVCGRTMVLEMMVNDTSGRTTASITGAQVDFGERIRDAVKALMDVCPDEHLMAGLMG